MFTEDTQNCYKLFFPATEDKCAYCKPGYHFNENDDTDTKDIDERKGCVKRDYPNCKVVNYGPEKKIADSNPAAKEWTDRCEICEDGFFKKKGSSIDEHKTCTADSTIEE